jgi:hypothetical protein
MKAKEQTFFWTSYTDLMTSLFFVMLALYILTVAMLEMQKQAIESQKKEIEAQKLASERDLQKIREMQKATESLPRVYFTYEEKYKRYALREAAQPRFEKGSAVIPHYYEKVLRGVGKSIQQVVNSLKETKAKYKDEDIKYLLVIEGMASKDNYTDNYRLSYQRALALYEFWDREGLLPDPDVCEVIIGGSGTGGVGRKPVEYENQRFLIQIIPKTKVDTR